MRLEDQLCPELQARKLRKLGVVQEGHFSWLFSPSSGKMEISHLKVEALELLAKSHPKSVEWKERTDVGIFSAWSVAELGHLLPDYITVDNYRMHLHEIKQDQSNKPAIFCVTIGRFEDKDIPTFSGTNEASVRADLLIHIIDNNFTTVDKINHRLSPSSDK